MPALYAVPETRRQWLRIALYAAVVVAGVLFYHSLVYQHWDSDQYIVDGDYIMCTHDAYHWLAGARDFGLGQGSPLAQWAKWASRVSGMSLTNVGFWTPVLATVLVGLVTLFWCVSLGFAEAGIVAGILAALSPGFFMRLRVGYYDTDVVTLFFPLLVTLLLGYWMAPHLRFLPGVDRARAWFARWRESRRRPVKTAKTRKAKKAVVETVAPDSEFLAQTQAQAQALDKRPVGFWLPLVAGALAGYGSGWHSSVDVFFQALALFLILLDFLVILRARRNEALLGSAVYALGALFYPWGLIPGLAIALTRSFAPRIASQALARTWPILVFLVLILGAGRMPQTVYQHSAYLVQSYVKVSVDQTAVDERQAADAMVFPGITQSVIEAQDVSLYEVLTELHPSLFLSLLGLLSYFLATLLYPQLLLLLPLTLLSLLSFKVGVRFSMFGAPAVALGLALPVAWLGNAVFGQTSRGRAWLFVLALIVSQLLCLPYYGRSTAITPTGIFDTSYAKALTRLEDLTPEDANIWIWWDWGYATHYYGLRRSFADGARHAGPLVFTLGEAMTSPSLLQSNQLIHYLGEHGYDPDKAWEGKSGQEVMGLLKDLGKEKREFAPESPAYIVVGKQDVVLMPWIAYYGTWDPALKTGTTGRVVRLRGQLQLNFSKGTVNIAETGQIIALKSATDMTGEQPATNRYRNLQGAHLVYSDEDYFLMDDVVYESTAMRLLMAPENDPEVGQFFRLVYNDFPNIRIYEVR